MTRSGDALRRAALGYLEAMTLATAAMLAGAAVGGEPELSATFSILAVDPETGVVGAAVASKYPAVGKVVPFVRAGVGGICTQHHHVPEWGTPALDALAKGTPPERVLADLLHDDPDRELRQLAIIDMQGRAAVHSPTTARASSRYWAAMTGRFYCCQGNTLKGRDVVTDMARVYEETPGTLADRLIAALVAGDNAGGDYRGKLAAGIRVARQDVDGTWLELYVDESDDAVTELARKYTALEHDAKHDAKKPADSRDAAAATQQGPVQVVMRRLKDLQYALPEGEFILLADQPLGTMQRAIVYDLAARQLIYLPGSRSDLKITREPLSDEAIRSLRAMVAQESVAKLEPEGGRQGLDGRTFVAMIRVGTLDKTLAHWQPEAPGCKLLDAFLQKEATAVEQQLRAATAQPPAALAPGPAPGPAARPAGPRGPAEPAGSTVKPGDALLAEYFRREAAAIGEACLAGIASREDWEARRGPARRELLEMLGLDPLPGKTPLAAVVTGTVEHEAFTVENLHFQSAPHLYVTANLYLPRHRTGPAPAILYSCGHAPEKLDGVSLGNKTHYRHHGEYFARHGYVCLVFDTLQLGEIEGYHHGTYNFDRAWGAHRDRWWWASRGYTPAGVEAWNGIRALDYLQSRPEVDPDRIGMTGRSGGGVGTWWTAAIDERVKVAVPVAGITDLHNQVVDGCVRGHCDCMFMVNTYRWDYPAIAALIAPRPLLVGNTDADWIFPLHGVVRTFEKARRIYAVLGAEKEIGLAVAAGPHEDGQELQLAALRWFDKHLRKDARPIESGAQASLPREKLRVFAQLPADEVNTRIDETFVAAAPAPPATEARPSLREDWPALRDAWLAGLRQRTFGGWPARDEPLDVAPAWAAERDGVAFAAYDFTSQTPFRLRLFVASPAGLARPKKTVLEVLDAEGWQRFVDAFGGSFAAELGLQPASAGNGSRAPAGEARLAEDTARVFVAPRGVGPTAWDADPKRHNQIRRRFYLLGQTFEGMQVYDIRRAVQAARGLPALTGTDLCLEGRGTTGALALYAALFEPGIAGVEISELPASHGTGPALLNVQRVLDLPQAVALAAERSPVVLHRPAGGADAWAYPRAVAAALGWPADRLRIAPE